ncbi:hypothetical protein BKA56DRAFT_506757 [Neofusicoccum parvum]|nr:hypothetical protein BKA56DRAFT_506757 [Neofusicoccum parvum]
MAESQNHRHKTASLLPAPPLPGQHHADNRKRKHAKGSIARIALAIPLPDVQQDVLDKQPPAPPRGHTHRTRVVHLSVLRPHLFQVVRFRHCTHCGVANAAAETSPGATSDHDGPADCGVGSTAGSGTCNPWRVPVDFLLAFTDPEAADTSEVVVKDASNECSHHDAGDSATLEATLQSNPWNHGDCLLDFFEFEIEMHRKSPPDPPPQPDPPAEPHGLRARMQEAVVQLSKTHASMARNGASNNAEFDWCLAESVFTVDNLRDFEWAYFHRIHRHNSVIHRPTFDCETVSLPLLLAVFLFGSVYSAPLDSALSARYFFECAEEYIYTHPTFRSLVDDLPAERGTVDEIQVLQAAVTIQTLQYGVNNKTTRRRIRVERHPHLVTAVRSAGFFQAKHSGPPTSWEEFIKTETLVR